MGSKVTVSRFVGLVFLVAALSSGTASAMSVEGTTPQGLKADGLRLQGIADRYAQMSGYTQDGLRADGLRYQAMARAYATARPAGGELLHAAGTEGRRPALAGDGSGLCAAAGRS